MAVKGEGRWLGDARRLEGALPDIFLTEERLPCAVSPLGDMVGHARSYHTRQSSHGGKLTWPEPRVKS